MSSVDELTNLFSKIGFEEAKVKEILKNAKVSSSLESLVNLASDDFPWNKNSRALIHTLAASLKGAEVPHLQYIVDGIGKNDLKTALQIDAALKYLKTKGEDATVVDLNKESGVGIEVTEDQVRNRVAKYVEDNKDTILKERYKLVPGLFAKIKALPELKWAEPRLFKPIIDEEILKVLGPKDERDIVKKEKKPKAEKKANGKASKDQTEEDGPKRSMFTEGFLGDLHKVGENEQAYPELMAEHLKATGGKVHTRFPPEPNGYLHIGHSKAIMVNFGFAKYHNGVCYLRFDDTNPEAEAPEYFESIKSMVSWLGFKPWKTTYSSDYFDELYQLAETLIKNGKAYVCHCSAEEIKRGRGIKEDGTPGGERKASLCLQRKTY